MPEETFMEKKEESISIHIFSVSAAMIGVCLTVTTLLNINESLKRIETRCDELLTLNAAIFLASCIISYLAMRTKDRKRRLTMERTAGWIFIAAIVMVAVVGVFIGWELM
jgi:hypothetical protein